MSMKKYLKALALSVCCVIGLTTVGFSAIPNDVNADNVVYTRDSAIANVEGVELITGDYSAAINASGSKYLYESRNHKNLRDDDIGGTDLGIPFYNSKNDTMYILYGDTYGTGRAETESGEDDSRNWRSSVMAISKDYDLSDGLTYDGWWRGGSDQAEAVIEGKHLPTGGDTGTIKKGTERTKIPQGGIEVNGVVYIYYESIRNFGTAGTWRVNYQGVIKSTDNCQTFERVPDLTWFPDIDNHGDYAIYSAAESWADATNTDVQSEDDITPQMLADAKAKIPNAEERNAPYFAQCYPVDGNDGYVYIFGRRAGRQHGIKVARVSYENIEKFDEHEYYTGNDKDGNPIWVKGLDGLKALDNDTVGYVLASGKDEPASNMSVMWNEYLGKWMLFYFRPAIFANGNGVQLYPPMVCFRLSDTVWGNYGELHEVMEGDFFTRQGSKNASGFIGMDADSSFTFSKELSFYAGFVHEKYQEQNGKVFYFIATIAGVYNSALFKVTLN